MKSLKLPFIALGIGFAALGCDSQVGPEFEGESQFSLGGELELGEDARDLVPALGFWLPETNEIAIVDVEVSGSFPANFRLDVLTPPPKAALMEHNGGSVAPGAIIVVPKDHSATYSVSSLGTHGYGLTCLQDSCELERHACVGDACFTQNLECKPFDACEVIEETGDPNLASDPSVERETWYSQDASDHSLEIARECVASGECHEVAKRCPLDPKYSGFDSYQPAGVTDCKVISESGDPALAIPSIIDDGVEGYQVLYAPRAFTFGSLDSLSQFQVEQGYSLVRGVDPADDKTWLANIRCQEAAELEAKLELDRRHGTSTAGTQGRWMLGLSEAQQRELEELMFAAAEDCPTGIKLETVPNPEAAGLKLRMGPRGSGPF